MPLPSNKLTFLTLVRSGGEVSSNDSESSPESVGGARMGERPQPKGRVFCGDTDRDEATAVAGIRGLITARIAKREARSARKPRLACVLLPLALLPMALDDMEEDTGTRESAASFEMCSRHWRTLASKSALRSLSAPFVLLAAFAVARVGGVVVLLLLLLLLAEGLGRVVGSWSGEMGNGLGVRLDVLAACAVRLLPIAPPSLHPVVQFESMRSD